MNINWMLKSTYYKMVEELNRCKRQLEDCMPEQINQAFETGGGWHDNPSWECALNEQVKLNLRCTELNGALAAAMFIDDLKIVGNRVSLGTEVLTKDLDTDKEEIFVILGSNDIIYNLSFLNENSPDKTFISCISPIAGSILKKSVQKKVVIRLPFSTQRLLILDIKPFIFNKGCC